MPMRYLSKDKVKLSHKASPVCQRSLVVGRNNKLLEENKYMACYSHCIAVRSKGQKRSMRMDSVGGVVLVCFAEKYGEYQ